MMVIKIPWPDNFGSVIDDIAAVYALNDLEIACVPQSPSDTRTIKKSYHRLNDRTQ